MNNTIHQIWVGPKPAPLGIIETWKVLNPHWNHALWDNTDFDDSIGYELWEQMTYMEEIEQWCGVADLMRLEILKDPGGLYLDADCRCIRPLNDELPEQFLVYENERAIPGMICNGIMRFNAGHPFIDACIAECKKLTRQDIRAKLPWEITGPKLITRVAKDFPDIPVIPARYFLPRHHSGVDAPGSVLPFADHSWGTTFNKY